MSDVEHRHERVGSLDGEPLHVHPRATDEALETVHLAQALEDGALLFRR